MDTQGCADAPAEDGARLGELAETALPHARIAAAKVNAKANAKAHAKADASLRKSASKQLRQPSEDKHSKKKQNQPSSPLPSRSWNLSCSAPRAPPRPSTGAEGAGG